MSGEYIDMVETPDGKYKPITVRVDTSEIIEELQRSIDHIQRRLKSTNEELSKVKNDKYKDDELQKMKDELERVRLENKYGFPITEDEHLEINEWMDDWFKKKRGGDKYMGAIGGGFIYKFHPTGIGTSGVVVAPDGEEFVFRELD